MKVSVVSVNEDFISYLEKRATGIQIVNRYRSLADESEFQRFSSDFNHVNLLLFIDFQDLSEEFKKLIMYYNTGKSYFLNAEEILLVTHEDPKMSPTPDLNKNLEAITAYMKTLGLKLRVVRLSNLKFQDIYKSLTVKDSINDSTPKKLVKYKVVENEEGVSIPPKKADIQIVPDQYKGYNSAHKADDLNSAKALEGTMINVPKVVERVRTQKDFEDFISTAITGSTAIFVTGLRYSGKTNFALTAAKELQEMGMTAAVVDLTSREDLQVLNKRIKCELNLLKGLSSDSIDGKPVLGIQVVGKVYTPSFISNIIKSLTQSRSLTFFEVDPEQFELLYTSFRGDKLAAVLVPNSTTQIRDTIKFASKLNFKVAPIINECYQTDRELKEETLLDSIPNSSQAFNVKDIPAFLSSIMN